MTSPRKPSPFHARPAFLIAGAAALLEGACGLVGNPAGAWGDAERRALDWRILGGGLAFGATVIALALGGVPYAQEVTFTVSMAVICTMLVLVTRDIGADHQRAILFTSIIIFAFRATPSVGDGYFWFTLDVLKFDEAFYGVLRQTGAIIAIVENFQRADGSVEVPEALVPWMGKRTMHPPAAG